MPRPALAVSVVTAALLVVGCGSPSARSTTDPPAVTASPSTGGAASATATTTATATPTPGTVPVDQIPPGRPARWIPAGMPTVAPWKEPGDVLPMFTLSMFEHTPAGALAAASFYVNARNWAVAALDPAPILMLCKSSNCKLSGDMIRGYASRHQHVTGARQQAHDRLLFPAPAGSDAEWVMRTHLVITKGAVVNLSGTVAEVQPQISQVNDIYLRWGGKLWLVHEDALAPKGTK